MNEEIERKYFKHFAIGTLLILLALFVSAASSIAIFGWPQKIENVGPLFSVCIPLFSGLAFLGAILALLMQRESIDLQRQDLKLQLEELKMTRVELSRTAKAQEQSVEIMIQNQTMLIADRQPIIRIRKLMTAPHEQCRILKVGIKNDGKFAKDLSVSIEGPGLQNTPVTVRRGSLQHGESWEVPVSYDPDPKIEKQVFDIKVTCFDIAGVAYRFVEHVNVSLPSIPANTQPTG